MIDFSQLLRSGANLAQPPIATTTAVQRGPANPMGVYNPWQTAEQTNAPTQQEMDTAISMMQQGRSQGWDGSWNAPGQLSLAGAQPVQMAQPDPGQGNFFDQFDEATVPTAPVEPSAAAPVEPMQSPVAAPDPVAPTVQPESQAPVPLDPTHQYYPEHSRDARDVDPELVAYNDQLATLINSGAPREQVYAFVAAHPQFTPKYLEENLDYRDKNPNRAVNVQVADSATNLPDPGKVGGAVLGAVDMLTVGFGDEIDAAIGAALKTVSGDGSYSDNYDQRLDDNQRVLRGSDELQPVATTVGRVAGAVALPSVGVAKGAGLAVNAARLGAEGATYGAAYGAGSAEGDLSDRVIGAVKGAGSGFVGGVIASPLALGAARVAANRAAGGSEGYQTLQAAERLNRGAPAEELIRPLPGHVGGPVTRTVHNLQEPSIIGGAMSGLAGKSERYQQNVGKALNRVSEDIAGGGPHGPKPVLSLADAAQRAGDASVPGSMAHYVENFQSMAQGPYRSAEALAKGERFATPRTLAKLDEILKRYRRVPGGVKSIGELQELRAALARGQHDLQGLRDLRTSFGDKLEINDRTVRGASKELWGVLSEDIFEGLKAAGKRDAALAYRRADNLYRENQVHLENIQKIIGKGDESSDAIARRIARMGQGDALRLQKALKALPIQMRGELQASIVKNLGRKSAGKATSDDDFSISTFATGWNKLDEQARNALVPNKSHRADLDAISTLANADRRLHKTGDNPSGTARMINNIGELGAAGSAFFGGPVSFGPLFGRWAGGLVLAQPLVAKAMVKVGNSGVTEGSLKMLNRAARMSPEYAGEIIGLRNYLESVQTGRADGPAPAPTIPDYPAPDMTGTGEPNYFDQFDAEG